MTIVGLVGTLIVAVTTAAIGAPGGLDPTFNPGSVLPGTVSTDVGSGQEGNDVAVQQDGSVVVVGSVDDGECGSDLLLVRYTADGDLDADFGIGGIVTLDGGDCSNDTAYGVAIDQAGRILVAGSTSYYYSSDFLVARFLPDGTPDDSFDGDGIVTTDFIEGSDSAHDVAIQPDGKIVAVGSGGYYPSQAAIARYEEDGELDAAFDGDGRLLFDAFDDGGEDALRGVTLGPDGTIVAAGWTFGPSQGQEQSIQPAAPQPGAVDALIVAVDEDGTLVAGFGDGSGAASLDVTGLEDAFDDITASGDRFVAVGHTGEDFLVTRWTSDGQLDGSFGSGGVVVTDFGLSSGATGVARTIDGGYAVGGSIRSISPSRVSPSITTSSSDDFALAKYLPTGALDPGFGSGGLVITDLPPGDDDRAEGLALDPREGPERIVLGGSGGVGIAAARYEGEPESAGPGPGPGPAAPDLSIDKEMTPDPVTSGDQVLATMQVTNVGSEVAGPATLIDDLPEGTTFVSVTSSQGSCTYDGASHRVTCDLGDVAPGAQVTVQIVFTAPEVEDVAVMTNEATVSAPVDANAGNDRGSDSITVRSKDDGDEAIGYIPPEGGSITTDEGDGATKDDPVYLTMLMGPQNGTQAVTPSTGGVAKLFERRCGKKNPLAPCIAKTLGDYQPPAGFTDVRAVFTFDRSVTKDRRPRSIVVAFQKAAGDPVLILERCGDPRVAPCVLQVRRLKASHDLRVRIFLGADPKMSVR